MEKASKVLYKILLISGIMLIAYSLVVMITFPKNQGAYFLASIGSLFFLYAAFEKRIKAASKEGLLKWLRIIIMGGACFVVLTFSLFCVNALLISFHVPSEGRDAIIVLGSGLRGEEVGPLLSLRLDKALEYYEENPGAVIVVSGGQGKDELISEALAMQRYLIGLGVSEEKILMEDKSTSTLENFEFSKKVLDEFIKKSEYTAVYVTNSFHCLRAGMYAEKAGFAADFMPAGTPVGMIPAYLARDYLGMAYVLVFGG